MHISHPLEQFVKNDAPKDNSKVSGYRKQQEFGQKKRIKP